MVFPVLQRLPRRRQPAIAALSLVLAAALASCTNGQARQQQTEETGAGGAGRRGRRGGGEGPVPVATAMASEKSIPVTVSAVNRLYLFNPQPWTKDSFTRGMEAFRR